MRRNTTKRAKSASGKLRTAQTFPEKLLWSRLRLLESEGFRFRKQHAIEHYVVDFACLSLRLVIELDGRSHIGREEEDLARQHRLHDLGWTVVRLRNDEVLNALDLVAQSIFSFCQQMRDSQ